MEKVDKVFGDVLLNRKQVSKLLNLSEVYICQLTREGKIPAYRIGRRILYSLNEIKEWLATKKIKKGER
jgi:excisionase family DNA binding protein